MTDLKGLYLSEKWDYETPDSLFNFLDDLFPFTLDVAANESNAKCKDFISQEMNALNMKWKTKGWWWLNPPWGNAYTKATGYKMEDWLGHASKQFANYRLGLVLVSARTDTNWWHSYARHAPWIWFPKGRVKFLFDGEVKKQPTFPSAILIYAKTLNHYQRKELRRKGHLVYTDHLGYHPTQSHGEAQYASAIKYTFEQHKDRWTQS